ncbi:hypothetical protein CERSUDRAFT_95868 [Gelatoporia subvermispora B]|uniref:Uncharacterized protein n=1 Tax=Ceriporiopsis subvermispora (strain B) TaxID=914234 RepID=M2RDQ6_CERS8|nr:hypothetical protein CERSUDRAFT_95868 [Gelatoporia subvermispora B]
MSSSPSLAALRTADTVTNMRRDLLSPGSRNTRHQLPLAKSTASFKALKESEPSSFSLFRPIIPAKPPARFPKLSLPVSTAAESSALDLFSPVREGNVMSGKPKKEDGCPRQELALGFSEDVLEILAHLEQVAHQVKQLPRPLPRLTPIRLSHMECSSPARIPANYPRPIILEKADGQARSPEIASGHSHRSPNPSNRTAIPVLAFPPPIPQSPKAGSRIHSAPISSVAMVPTTRKRANTLGHPTRTHPSSPAKHIPPASAVERLPSSPPRTKLPRLSMDTPKHASLKGVFRPRQSAPPVPTHTAIELASQAHDCRPSVELALPVSQYAKQASDGAAKGFNAGLRKRSQSLRNLLKPKTTH